LREVKKALGIFVADGVHYNSSTKGVVEIAKMEDTHIKNAIRKIITGKVQALDTRATNRDFLTNLQNLTAGDVTLVGLVMELAKRINR
jgi:HD superfamily phosphohydrolase YqeK